MTIDEILENFALLDDWEDRYRYVIELGKELDPLPESERSAQNKVRGCASQVWLSTHVDQQQKMPRLTFRGDSLVPKGGGVSCQVGAGQHVRVSRLASRPVCADSVVMGLEAPVHAAPGRSSGYDTPTLLQ